jgi:hypothetical protein
VQGYDIRDQGANDQLLQHHLHELGAYGGDITARPFYVYNRKSGKRMSDLPEATRYADMEAEEVPYVGTLKPLRKPQWTAADIPDTVHPRPW